jgi:hypothetical protein
MIRFYYAYPPGEFTRWGVFTNIFDRDNRAMCGWYIHVHIAGRSLQWHGRTW